jgi:preprotein translocase subunit SecG
MVTILISLFMFVLLVVSGLMTVIILMQKPSANAGMGAALGGGAAESVFGGEAAGALLKFTVRIAVAFFVISFLLYLGIVAANRPATTSGAALPTVSQLGGIPAAPATPATSGTPTTTAAISTKTTGPAAADATKAPSPTTVPASGSAK